MTSMLLQADPPVFLAKTAMIRVYVKRSFMTPLRTYFCAVALLVATACSPAGNESGPAFLLPDNDTIDFGGRVVGGETARLLFLFNKGNVPLTLEPPTGDALGGIFEVQLEQTVIQPLNDIVVHVLFRPEALQQYATEFTFANDSSNMPTFILKVTGEGVVDASCADVVCNDPEPARCVTSSMSRTFDAVGECSGGNCLYPASDNDCGGGSCDTGSGLCSGDLCAEVVCETPPNECFYAKGACTNGSCLYAVHDGAPCSDGDLCTIGDSCLAGSCHGASVLACTTPPAEHCADADNLRRYHNEGFCNAQSGECDYTYVDYLCPFGCANDACREDPCKGGCDDGDPCTFDECVIPTGCVNTLQDGLACDSGDSDCPTGSCVGGACVLTAGAVCQAVIESFGPDCPTGTIPGECTSKGECEVINIPSQYQCVTCPDSICVQCPGFPICLGTIF